MASLYIVEDNSALRNVLRTTVHQPPDWNVVGTAGRAEAALQDIRTRTPDLVITDLSLPEKSGLELTAELAGVPVIVYSIHGEPIYVRRAVAAGARGYVSKGQGLNQLQEAIRHVLRGETYGLVDDSGEPSVPSASPERDPPSSIQDRE